MSDKVEVIVASDESGLVRNVCIWDSHTGTALKSYKGGGITSPHCISLLGNDYLICGEKSKSLLHVWALNSEETIQQMGNMVCPGCVTALAISPTNCYCVAAISEKLYVWEIASGRLLTVAAKHYRPVTCIKFTDDGSSFASGGQDGMVLVWSLAYLISRELKDMFVQPATGNTGPRYTFSDHSLPVADIYIGHGGMRAKMLSVSGDRNCKIYDLASGTLLLSVVFGTAVNAVTLGTSESEVFVGALNGHIYSFNLRNPPRTREYHFSEEDKNNAFVGHTKAVTCVSASLDGCRLLSASKDATIMIWDIPSRQCIRKIPHVGAVNNAFFTIIPKQVFSDTFNPTIILQSFKRTVDDASDQPYTIMIKTNQKLDTDDKFERPDAYIPDTIHEEKSSLQDEVNSLKKINKELYEFAINKLLKK